MFYNQQAYGVIKREPRINRAVTHAPAVDVLKAGGYADIFKGRLEIKIETPKTEVHQRYCKAKGFSDQGYRHD